MATASFMATPNAQKPAAMKATVQPQKPQPPQQQGGPTSKGVANVGPPQQQGGQQQPTDRMWRPPSPPQPPGSGKPPPPRNPLQNQYPTPTPPPNGHGPFPLTPPGQKPQLPGQGPQPGYAGPQPGNWNPQLPTGQPPRPGTPATPESGTGGFFGGFNPWDTSQYEKPDGVIPNYIASALPVAQLDHNKYVYGNDFNEAQRRWDIENGQAQSQNNFQMGLSTQQQQMAEWQAQTNSDQFQQQFGHTQQMDYAGFDLSQQEVDQTGAYQTGLIGNQATLNAGQVDRWQGETANDARQNQNQLHLGNAANANQQFANDTGRLEAQNQFTMGTQANNIEQQYKQGLITNEQRNLALQELVQSQSNTFAYADLAQRAQQAGLDRESMQGIANTQAYGRSAAPQMNWSRSWS